MTPREETRLRALDVLSSVVDQARQGGPVAHNLPLNLYVGRLIRRARAGRPLTAAEATIVDAAGGRIVKPKDDVR